MLGIIATKILPVNLIFLIGYFLKNKGILKEEDGGVFLKLTFYILIPAMLFNSMRSVELSWSLLLYPLLIAVVQGLMHLVGLWIYKGFKITRAEKPVVVSSLMVMNTGFIIPFFVAFYGQEEVWRVGLFDFGNAFITFSVTYSIFLNNNSEKIKTTDFTQAFKVIKSPPVIAIILGVFFNVMGLKTPATFEILTGNLSILVGPMVMLALGLYFNPKIEKKMLTGIIVVGKFLTGGIIATLLSALLGLDGVTRTILYLMACSPVGTNILTFSMLTDSDMNLASGIVSLSTLLNLFMIPLLIILLS